MQVMVTINSCLDCRYLVHSGAFTPSGAFPVCRHPVACYGSHASVPAGSSVKDVMIQHGMDPDSAEQYENRAIKGNDDEVERILLADSFYTPGDCLHWVHRVPFVGKPNTPDWCPLKSGARY